MRGHALDRARCSELMNAQGADEDRHSQSAAFQRAAFASFDFLLPTEEDRQTHHQKPWQSSLLLPV